MKRYILLLFLCGCAGNKAYYSEYVRINDNVNKVAVLGEATKQKAVVYENNMSAMMAIAEAEGLLSRRSNGEVRIIRDNELYATFNVKDVLSGIAPVPVLQKGDAIYAPSNFMAKISDIFMNIFTPVIDIGGVFVGVANTTSDIRRFSGH